MAPCGLLAGWLVVQLLAVACGGDGSPTPALPATYLVSRAPVADLGTVWEGAVLEHVFELETRGTQDLVLREVGADCGCTVPSLEVVRPQDGEPAPYEPGTPIPPGSKLILQVRYNTSGKVGEAPRSVHMIGNLPQGRTDVILRANVRRWLKVEPERVDLPELFVADSTETRFHVSSPDGTPFELTHVALAIPDQVVVRLEPDHPGEDGRASAWDVIVELGPNLPTGTHGYPIQLRSDVENPDASPDEEGHRPVFAAMPFIGIRVVGLVSTDPGRLTFGVVQAGETVSRTVRVSSHDPGFHLPEPRARLEPLKPDEPFPLGRTARITTRAVPGEEAWDVQLLLDGLDPGVPRTFLARLVIDTGHPEVGRLEVPVTGAHLTGGTPPEGGG